MTGPRPTGRHGRTRVRPRQGDPRRRARGRVRAPGAGGRDLRRDHGRRRAPGSGRLQRPGLGPRRDAPATAASAGRALAAIAARGWRRPALDFEADAQIPSRAGLGSSAALAVAVARAAAAAIGRAERRGDRRGRRRGRDGVPRQPVGHRRGRRAERRRGAVLARRRLAPGAGAARRSRLCVGLSGRPRDTAAQVAAVARLRERLSVGRRHPGRCWDGWPTRRRAALGKGDVDGLGRIFDAAHGLLVRAARLEPGAGRAGAHGARAAGAIGAKLTGAGGGGAVIALAPGHERDVLARWRAAGFDGFLAEIAARVQAVTARRSDRHDRSRARRDGRRRHEHRAGEVLGQARRRAQPARHRQPVADAGRLGTRTTRRRSTAARRDRLRARRRAPPTTRRPRACRAFLDRVRARAGHRRARALVTSEQQRPDRRRARLVGLGLRGAGARRHARRRPDAVARRAVGAGAPRLGLGGALDLRRLRRDGARRARRRQRRRRPPAPRSGERLGRAPGRRRHGDRARRRSARPRRWTHTARTSPFYAAWLRRRRRRPGGRARRDRRARSAGAGRGRRAERAAHARRRDGRRSGHHLLEPGDAGRDRRACARCARGGTPVFFTIDAGPHVKALCARRRRRRRRRRAGAPSRASATT